LAALAFGMPKNSQPDQKESRLFMGESIGFIPWQLFNLPTLDWLVVWNIFYVP